jgi:hypothetical protein
MVIDMGRMRYEDWETCPYVGQEDWIEYARYLHITIEV